jgi:hypothetical protein
MFRWTALLSADRQQSLADQRAGLRDCRKFYAMFGCNAVAAIAVSTLPACGRGEGLHGSMIELNASGPMIPHR